MKATSGFLLLMTVAVAAQTPPPRRVIDFESDKPGQAPGGFAFALTGSGRPGAWSVRKDDASPERGNVLAQTDADSTSYRFPVAVLNDIVSTDVEVSVRFRPMSGRVDQAAGVVWRYRDANNYYIVRANALEGNVVLYKVENGKRTDLPVKGSGRTYGKKASVPTNTWSQLGITVRGPVVHCVSQRAGVVRSGGLDVHHSGQSGAVDQSRFGDLFR